MEYDIVVVGAGPAGLTAAVRAAWLAAPAATYRARILVLEASDQTGGLSRWQPLVLNTPGVFFNKPDLLKLVETGEHFGIEIRYEQVMSLRQCDDGMFEIETAEVQYRSLSVIVATGCKLSHPGESRLFHRKRILWFESNAALDHLIDQLEADASIRTLCLYGAERVLDTRRHIGTRRSLDIITCAEPPYTGTPPGVDMQGRLVQISVDSEQQRLQLRVARHDSRVEEFKVDVMIVDFNAYESTATTTQILDDSVSKSPDKFLNPGRDMATGTAGLFSAGDVNGVPFCVAKALSDGVIAGYSAYEYVCVQRTGKKPNLFPYYPYEV